MGGGADMEFQAEPLQLSTMMSFFSPQIIVFYDLDRSTVLACDHCPGSFSIL